MKYPVLLLLVICFITASCKASKSEKTAIPFSFVNEYYTAYSGVPTASRLARFYADSVVIDDPTYDWVGTTKASIFKNFDTANLKNDYEWHIDQEIKQGNKLVVEGLLKARYGGIPYQMRFVNIFHFKNGLIIRQYDYFDNKDWYKVVEQYKQQQAEKVKN
jgi:limonene-1,2-epoxide hydrolase